MMRYVIDQNDKVSNQTMISVLKMEIDYELVSLHDAIVANETAEIIKTKEKLINLVSQLKKRMKKEETNEHRKIR